MIHTSMPVQPGPIAKDFNLITMQLTSTTGAYLDLRFVFLEFSVYEEIWNNNITCDILINDARNMLMNFPVGKTPDGIFGFETLDLSFQTPNRDIWEKQFRLVSISDRKLIREREMGYILHFVTPEAVQNLHTRVSKAYKGMLISDIVDDLHNNWLDGGNIQIETTSYQHHIIVPNLHPTHAINWLCTRANSANFDGANYLYFQDKNQFNFVSLESILQQNAQTPPYLFQVANVRRNTSDGNKPITLDSDQVAAERYNFDHFSDILENMQAGMYGNQLLVHSQVNKTWSHYEFDYPDSFNDYQHLYDNNLLWSSGGVGAPVNSPAARLKMHSDGPPDFPFHPEAWIPIRISQLQQLQNIKLTITVPGDSSRTIGQIVTFNLPSPEPPINDEQVNDKYYAGNFLVASVRHKIDVDKYMTIMELVKDSSLNSYPA